MKNQTVPKEPRPIYERPPVQQTIAADDIDRWTVEDIGWMQSKISPAQLSLPSLAFDAFSPAYTGERLRRPDLNLEGLRRCLERLLHEGLRI